MNFFNTDLDHLEPAPSRGGSDPKRMRLSSEREKFSLEALQREEEQNLQARMQIEMLKNQTQHQQVLLENPNYQAPSSRSRFDQQYHPSQMTQPGVVVPQTIHVPNHAPPVVSMMGQGGYEASRMRSRSPPRQVPGKKFLLILSNLTENFDCK